MGQVQDFGEEGLRKGPPPAKRRGRGESGNGVRFLEMRLPAF